MNALDFVKDDRVKGCPFCGADSSLEHQPQLNGYFVQCVACNVSQFTVSKTIEAAVSLWNRRHDETPSEFERCMK